jgi:hypothetical protein
MWGWACVLFLLLMNSAQAMHLCGLQDELRPHFGHGVNLSSDTADHTFCVICASCHSPSLASPFVYLFSVDGLSRVPLPARGIQRSAAPVFALYIRPPPVA